MRLTSLVSHVTSRLDLTHCLTAYGLHVTVTPLGLGLVQVLTLKTDLHHFQIVTQKLILHKKNT